MIKNGDDVRQDQMVIQMIRIMDKLLKDMNLDLCLSPYSVLAIEYLNIFTLLSSHSHSLESIEFTFTFT